MKYQGKRVQIRTNARDSKPQQYDRTGRMHVKFEPALAAATAKSCHTSARSITRETNLELVLKQQPLMRSTNISMPQNESRTMAGMRIRFEISSTDRDGRHTS